MQTKGRHKTGLTGVCAVITGIITVLCIFLGGRAYSTISRRLYLERKNYFEATTEEINEHIQNSVRQMWKFTEFAEKSFVSDNPDTLGEAFESLSYMSGSLSNAGMEFFVVDADKNCYDAKGSVSKWDNLKPLPDAGKMKAVCMPKKVNSEDDCFFTYIIRFAEDIKVKNGEETLSLRYITCNVKTSCLASMLKSQIYDRKNLACIVNKNGSKIYYDRSDTKVFTKYNIKAGLESCVYKYGTSYEELYENWQNDRPYTALVDYNGGSYFLSVQPMKVGDVSLVMVVNEEYVSADSTDFVNTILQQALALGAVLVLLIVLVFFMLMHANNEYKLAQKEALINKKLVEANNALSLATKEANKANLAKTDFLSKMSHDIRTPMNSIMGMVSIAEKNRGNPAVVEDCLNKIHISSRHLLALINEVLDISRLENGVNQWVEEHFDMQEVIDTSVMVINNCINNRSLEFSCVCEPLKYTHVIGSALHLRQILINILSNAVKYTNDGGRIVFTVKERLEDENTVMYSYTVQDNGIGMSNEFLQHIFDDYTREENAVETMKDGAGLGMSIAKKLVDRMGGTIKVKSRLNIGSRFEVEIPFKISDEYKISIPEEVKADDDLEGIRILLVEDNDTGREIIRYMLNEKGILVDEAANGMEGVRMYENAPCGTYAMILMDVMMPVMDGIEAAESIRKSKKDDAATIPVIALTANAFSEDIKKAKLAGMNDHISKPVNIELMFEKIKKWSYSKHP